MARYSNDADEQYKDLISKMQMEREGSIPLNDLNENEANNELVKEMAMSAMPMVGAVKGAKAVGQALPKFEKLKLLMGKGPEVAPPAPKVVDMAPEFRFNKPAPKVEEVPGLDKSKKLVPNEYTGFNKSTDVDQIKAGEDDVRNIIKSMAEKRVGAPIDTKKPLDPATQKVVEEELDAFMKQFGK